MLSVALWGGMRQRFFLARWLGTPLLRAKRELRLQLKIFKNLATLSAVRGEAAKFFLVASQNHKEKINFFIYS